MQKNGRNGRKGRKGRKKAEKAVKVEKKEKRCLHLDAHTANESAFLRESFS